jgi:hypothetical protein
MYEQDSKIAIRKTMPGAPATMGSIIRSSPTKWMGFCPFEILFGHLSPLVKGLQRDLKEIGGLTLRQKI